MKPFVDGLRARGIDATAIDLPKRKAEEAAREAVEDPATPEQAKNAATADINEDGFVTLDEVAALEKAGLTDDEMVERLRLTGQVFELAGGALSVADGAACSGFASCASAAVAAARRRAHVRAMPPSYGRRAGRSVTGPQAFAAGTGQLGGTRRMAP